MKIEMKNQNPKDICSYCGKKLRKTNWGNLDRNPSGMHDICNKRKLREQNDNAQKSGATPEEVLKLSGHCSL